MKLAYFLLSLACTGLGLALAQSAPDFYLEDPSVLRAKMNVEKIRSLVDSGTLPRVRLEKAIEALADTEDEALITRALYGKDLSPDQAAETVKAATRRLERRKKTVADQQHLLEQGIISQSELKLATGDLERITKEYEWTIAREKLVAEIANFAAAEAALLKQMEEGTPPPGSRLERYAGKGSFTPLDFDKVQRAYSLRFSSPLPISANGETAVHRAMGFDHRNRIDVCLYPDSSEGQWLRHYLTANRIPYFAFRGAIAGQATGAHIHMGPASIRLAPARPSPVASSAGN